MIFELKTKIFYQIWIILVIQMRIFQCEAIDSDSTNKPVAIFGITNTEDSTLDSIMPNWCDSLETSFNDTIIYWPKIRNSYQYVTSLPICLDELKFPKFRYFNQYCNQKKSLQCTYIQHHKNPSYCPNGELALLIKNDHKICFSDSTKYESQWDYTPCLQYGSILPEFFELNEMDHTKLLILMQHIKDNIAKKFWLPIRRQNSYSPLQYFIPFFWKRYIHLEDYDYDKFVTPITNCLAIEFIDEYFHLHFEDCDNKYPMLCAYDAFDHKKIECINDNYVLHSDSYTTKYSYVQNGLNCPYGQISVANSPETSKVYKKLLGDQVCAVNVFPNTDINSRPPVNLTDYYNKAPCGINCALNITDWIERFSEIEYINWNVDDIGYGEKIVVDSTGGWTLHNHPRCTVCEDTIGSSTIPTLVLDSNQNNYLTLIISVDHHTTPENVKNDSFDNLCNFKKLLGVNCFAQYGNMQYENFHLNELAERNFNTYSSENITTVIDIVGISYNEVYSIKVNKSGRFWCEGYSIFHNLVISSDDLYIEVANDTENFASILKITGFKEVLLQYQVEDASEHLRDVLNEELEVFEISLNSVQFKSFIAIDYTKQQLIALVHFEFSLYCEDNRCVEGRFELLSKYYNFLWNAMELLNQTEFTFYSLNHTQFCLPEENVVNGITLYWGKGELNEYVTTKNFILEETGLPIVRQCRGDMLYGLQWGIVNELNGISIMAEGIITKELFNLEQLLSTQSNESMKILTNITSIVTVNINQLIPADLFTISKVLSYLDAFNFQQYSTSENFNGISNITAIIDSCTQANKSVIEMSQVVNTTNKILYSFEMAISNIGSSFKPKRDSLLVKSSNVLVIVLNPGTNNISGISVYKNLTKTVLHNDISDYYIEYILSNASITTFNEGFAIASYVPQSLLKNLLNINSKLQLIITLFYNDALYQDETRADQLDSIIISVTIPGISSRLPGFMPFYFTSKSNSRYTLSSNESMNQNNYCSYWNFQPKNKTIKSEWSQDGCYFMGLLTTTLNTSQISACTCEHLTSFAFLVGDMKVTNVSDTINSIPEAHGKALDILTLLGCSLSILGALGIFITAFVFPMWRRKSGILLQFSGAIAVQMILTLCVTTNLIDFEVTRNTKWTGCIIVGALIQYSLLVVFSWTLISAYLQFKRYVSVFNSKPSNLYLKTFIVGWLIPLVPVLLGVFISPESYRETIKNSFNVCYPTHYALYFTVLLPIGLIVLANLTIFIIVVRNVFQMSSNKFHSNEKDLILSQLRLSVFLFFLLGLSWGFGLAISFGLGLVFSYLFCITATVQGLVLFIYFVLMDPETRGLWVNLFYCKTQFCKKFHM